MLDFLEDISICQSEEERKKEGKFCHGIIYRIKEGDTLYGIAKKYQLRVRDILFSNPYIDLYQLQAGEELCIPAIESKSMQAMEEFDTYRIKEGDTLSSILKERKVSFEELVKLNKSISNLTLPEDTVLLLPQNSEM